jgi:hypothetical protein
LPDGLFSDILKGLKMENVGIFYGYLVIFKAVWKYGGSLYRSRNIWQP